MEKPILFNTEMVRAILDGRKTQTRRLIRPQPEGQLSYIMGGSNPGKWDYMSASEAKAWDVEENRICKQDDGSLWTPPCHADDLLYVRETWSELYYVDPDGYTHYDRKMYFYAADGEPDIELLDADGFLEEDQRIRWKPSIHMPKDAARIWLMVTNVRVQRLKDITEDDALAEGASGGEYLDEQGNSMGIVWPHEDFSQIWDSTIKAEDIPLYGWDANPWVWVINFERLEGKHDD